MDGVKQSVPLLIAGLAPGTKVGLWEFGNQLDPPHDLVQLAPLEPLATGKDTILSQLTAVTAIRTGTSLMLQATGATLSFG